MIPLYHVIIVIMNCHSTSNISNTHFTRPDHQNRILYCCFFLWILARSCGHIKRGTTLSLLKRQMKAITMKMREGSYLLAYFPYFVKIKGGLWDHLAVCVSVYPHRPSQHLKARITEEPEETAIARKWLGKHIPATTNIQAKTEKTVRRVVFYEICVVSNTQYLRLVKGKQAISSSQDFLLYTSFYSVPPTWIMKKTKCEETYLLVCTAVQLAESQRMFRRNISACSMLVSCLAYSSTLKTMVICSSEALADFHQTTWSYISEDTTLHSYCCETPKCKKTQYDFASLFSLLFDLIYRTYVQRQHNLYN
jgi:hypothetical protein